MAWHGGERVVSGVVWQCVGGVCGVWECWLRPCVVGVCVCRVSVMWVCPVRGWCGCRVMQLVCGMCVSMCVVWCVSWYRCVRGVCGGVVWHVCAVRRVCIVLYGVQFVV